MAIIGFQDIWLTGSRVYFRRDPVGNQRQPVVDLGIIEPVSTRINVRKASKYNSECGRLVQILEAASSVSESMDVVCRNFSLKNLALLFGAEFPEDAEIVQEDLVIGSGTYVRRGNFTQTTSPSGEIRYNATNIYGAYTSGPYGAKVLQIDEIAAPSNIYLDGNQEGQGLYAGQELMIPPLSISSPGRHWKTYTITSDAVYDPFTGKTSVQVTPDIYPPAEGPGSSGVIVHGYGSKFDVDNVSAYNLANSLVSVGSASVLDGPGGVIYGTETRKIQKITAYSVNSLPLEGEAIIFWCREDGSQQSARICRVSVAPGQEQVFVDQNGFSSFRLTFTVLKDEDDSYGKFVYFIGDVPSTS